MNLHVSVYGDPHGDYPAFALAVANTENIKIILEAGIQNAANIEAARRISIATNLSQTMDLAAFAQIAKNIIKRMVETGELARSPINWQYYPKTERNDNETHFMD